MYPSDGSTSYPSMTNLMTPSQATYPAAFSSGPMKNSMSFSSMASPRLFMTCLNSPPNAILLPSRSKHLNISIRSAWLAMVGRFWNCVDGDEGGEVDARLVELRVLQHFLHISGKGPC